jgi:hypothetical protein
MNDDRKLSFAVRDLLLETDLSTEQITLDDERIRVLYLPRFVLPKLKDCQVSIAPRSRVRELASRTSSRREHTIQICTMMQCKPDSELMDALIDLCTTFEDLLATQHQVGVSTLDRPATYLRSNVDELYSIDTLEQDNVFKSIITATYQIVK